jgi:hypothetical protein
MPRPLGHVASGMRQGAFKPSKFVLPIGKNPSDLASKSRTNGETMQA